MSYEEVKFVMGEASRVLKENWGTLYMYDDEGLFFEDQNSPLFLKKQKAYIDEEHKITSLSLYVSDKQDLLQEMVSQGIWKTIAGYRDQKSQERKFQIYSSGFDVKV